MARGHRLSLLLRGAAEGATGLPTSLGSQQWERHGIRFATLALMPMTQGLTSESDYLYVTATGAFSLDEAQLRFLEMLESVAELNLTKVLFDGRMLVGEPQMMERFYYGEFAARSVASFVSRGLSPATRFAYVLEEPILHPERFGETVAVNRGMRVRAFDNLEAARAWLEAA